MPELAVRFLFIGAGGAAGSVLRYATGLLAVRLFPGARYPLGTMAVNLAGCFLIGILAGLSESRHVIGPEARMVLAAGFLGGFTTFSAFGFETMALVRAGDPVRAALNVAVQVGVGVLAVWLGDLVAR